MEIFNNIKNIDPIIPVITAIVPIVFFLIKFFGKAYADQVPFADNRSWHEEIFGISFFSTQVLAPGILVLLLFNQNFRFWHFQKGDWVLLGINALVLISSTIISNQSKKFFEDDNFYEGNYFSLLKKVSNPDSKEKIDNGDKIIILKKFLFPVVTILIMIGVGFLYRWDAYYHLISSLILSLFYFTSLALMFSLIKRHIVKANIYFLENKENAINNCRVVKVNNDNVKIKTEDNRVFILSKSSISKIEFIKSNNIDNVHK
jgi:hypothetical protein